MSENVPRTLRGDLAALADDWDTGDRTWCSNFADSLRDLLAAHPAAEPTGHGLETVIAGVLAIHGEVWGDVALHGWECRCGWPGDEVRHTEGDYRAHVAAAVRAHLEGQ